MFYHGISLVLFPHVVAAFIAAFIAFPFAFLAKKGSKPHIFAGRAFVICFIIIFLTGIIMDYDELTKINFLGILSKKYNLFSAAKSSNQLLRELHVFNTVVINFYALYLVISGMRIARQHYKGTKTTNDAIFDGAFALFCILLGGIFCLASFIIIYHNAYKEFTIHSIKLYYFLSALISSVIVLEGSRDLYLAIKKIPPRVWWFAHMRKMITAELGVLSAFVLRCKNFVNAPLIELILAVGFLIGFIIVYKVQKKSSNPKLK